MTEPAEKPTGVSLPTNVAFYRGLLDSLLEGVYCLDRHRVISFWNRAAEEITGYRAEEVLGKHCHDNVLVHTDEQGNPMCVSLCPAAAALYDGARREHILYLQHRDGHRLPVRTRVAPIREADGSISGVVEMFADATLTLMTRERLEALTQAAMLDPLTGVGNRRYAEMALQERIANHERYKWPFGVLFVDVDHFKNINDTYGHKVGDDVLTVVAHTLTNCVRGTDVVARWGGEEFVLLLSNLVPSLLPAQAEKVRRLVEQSGFNVNGDVLHVTASVGGLTVPPALTMSEIMERVDALMYKAKQAGRNRICLD